MVERPVSALEQLQSKAHKLERAKETVRTVAQNLGNDLGPKNLNFITPEFLPTDPADKVLEIIRRGTKVAEVRQYVSSRKLPSLDAQITEVNAEIGSVQAINLRENISRLRNLSSLFSSEELAALEAQIRQVVPDVSLNNEPQEPVKPIEGSKPSRKSPEQEKSLPNIFLDEEKRSLTINEIPTKKLAKLEFALVKYLYDHPGEVASSEIWQTIKAGSKSKTNLVRSLIRNIEERKLNQKIFRRIGERGNIKWALDRNVDTEKKVGSEEKKTSILPMPTERISILNAIMENPDQVTIEQVIALMGTDKHGKPLTWVQALWGLNRSANILIGRTKRSKASEDEVALRNKIKVFTGKEDNQDVLAELRTMLRSWFDSKRGREVTPKLPNSSIPAKSVVVSPVKNQEMPDFREIKTLPEMRMFLDHLSKPTQILIEKFLDSEQGRIILNNIEDFEPINAVDADNFTQRLAGVVFEQLGYHYLADQYSKRSDLTVLSPEEVFTLFQKLYPNREVTNFSGFSLNYGIDGITFPDGLIFRETSSELLIDAVIEYKAWARSIPNLESLQRQLRYYQYELFVKNFSPNNQSFYEKTIREVKPDLPNKPIKVSPNFEIMFGIPENSVINISENVTEEHIPVDSRDFRLLINLLIKAMNNNERMTEQEIMELATEAETTTQPASASITEDLEKLNKQAEGVQFPDGQDTKGLSETDLRILEGLLMVSEEKPVNEEELAKFVFPDLSERVAISRLRLAMPSFKSQSIKRGYLVNTNTQTADKKMLLFLTKVQEDGNNGSQAKLA